MADYLEASTAAISAALAGSGVPGTWEASAALNASLAALASPLLNIVSGGGWVGRVGRGCCSRRRCCRCCCRCRRCCLVLMPAPRLPVCVLPPSLPPCPQVPGAQLQQQALIDIANATTWVAGSTQPQPFG